MKSAIISDTHDNVTNFQKITAFLVQSGITHIIHCGDICRPETLAEGCDGFEGELHVVFGNADIRDLFLHFKYPETLQVTVHGEVGSLQLGEKKIACVHYPDAAQSLAEVGDYDMVFHGHTHKPWEEQKGMCRVVNPGNVAGILYKATFALYDSDKDSLELKILDTLNT